LFKCDPSKLSQVISYMSCLVLKLSFSILQERRLEKKDNKKAFTKEKIRQDKEVINLNNNLKGVHIV